MGNMKHTPGPWILDEDGMVYGQNKIVADPHCADQDIDEREANAHLIAAAPELLRFLEELCNSVDSFMEITPFDSVLRKSRALIKKAKGET